MSAWVRMVPVGEATGLLKDMYAKVTTPHGTVDNVFRAHSLRPLTAWGHYVLYASVLHPDKAVARGIMPGLTEAKARESAHSLPFWFLETVAAYVSAANNCGYSFTHHWANAKRLIKRENKARAAANRAALDIDTVLPALLNAQPALAFAGKERALLDYAHKLTVSVGRMARADYDALKAAGCDDGEIVEVNQVVAYFNYSNRLLNGLGVTTEGDVIGYYKDED